MLDRLRHQHRFGAGLPHQPDDPREVASIALQGCRQGLHFGDMHKVLLARRPLLTRLFHPLQLRILDERAVSWRVSPRS